MSRSPTNQIWTLFDKDSNGTLDRDEVTKMLEHIYRQMKSNLTTNYGQGGRYGDSERRTLNKAMHQCEKLWFSTKAQVMDRFDTNHDGLIDYEEFRSGFKPMLRMLFLPVYDIYTEDKAWDHIVDACEMDDLILDGDLDMVWQVMDKDGNGTLEKAEAISLLDEMLLAIRDKLHYDTDLQLHMLEVRVMPRKVAGSPTGAAPVADKQALVQMARLKAKQVAFDRAYQQIHQQMQAGSTPGIFVEAFKSLDVDHDGHVTKAEFKAKIRAVYTELERGLCTAADAIAAEVPIATGNAHLPRFNRRPRALKTQVEWRPVQSWQQHASE